MKSYIVTTYLTYLPIVITMTILVARILFKNSKVFMLDIFKGREEIALPTNRLLEIGFYLLNVGTALLILKSDTILSTQVMVETLSHKIGGFSIYLGVMLFFYLYLFFRGKRKAGQRPQNIALK
ncbi:hypothetical protein [Xanthovirga aplysinae]|uniref:hypothetical protein n=1 Tax=Xanthovirga aplysinae TaxID=2529853 RepID=UPI0012BBD635|nr:hypothetical protein [Xanthovirga aplysinae]MTI31333.1 hypothetical protein [Xanthovirga aplysinae]